MIRCSGMPLSAQSLSHDRHTLTRAGGKHACIYVHADGHTYTSKIIHTFNFYFYGLSEFKYMAYCSIYKIIMCLLFILYAVKKRNMPSRNNFTPTHFSSSKGFKSIWYRAWNSSLEKLVTWVSPLKMQDTEKWSCQTDLERGLLSTLRWMSCGEENILSWIRGMFVYQDRCSAPRWGERRILRNTEKCLNSLCSIQ